MKTYKNISCLFLVTSSILSAQANTFYHSVDETSTVYLNNTTNSLTSYFWGLGCYSTSGAGHDIFADENNTHVFNFGAGTYYVLCDDAMGHALQGAIRIGRNWQFVGDPSGRTKIKLMRPPPLNAAPYETSTAIIFSNDPAFSTDTSTYYLDMWARNFTMRNITIDCAPLTPYSSTQTWPSTYANCPFRVHGVSVSCRDRLELDHVNVNNIYGDGANFSNGAEVFGIIASTAGNGIQNRLYVHDCQVLNVTNINFGYSTGIAASSAAWGFDTRTIGVNGSTVNHGSYNTNSLDQNNSLSHSAGLICNNVVSNSLHGIGLGACGSSMEVFRGNSTVNCVVGFNCDTGVNDLLCIDGNIFNNCEYGIYLGGYNAVTHSYIERNTFVMNNDIAAENYSAHIPFATAIALKGDISNCYIYNNVAIPAFTNPYIGIICGYSGYKITSQDRCSGHNQNLFISGNTFSSTGGTITNYVYSVDLGSSSPVITYLP